MTKNELVIYYQRQFWEIDRLERELRQANFTCGQLDARIKELEEELAECRLLLGS